MKRMIISIGIGFSLMHSAITLSAMRTESLEEHTFCQLVDQIPFAMKKNLSPRRSHENNQSSQVTIEKNNWTAFNKVKETLKHFNQVPENWTIHPLMYIAQKYYETKASINYQECWGDDKISILITSFPNLDVNVIDKTGSTLLHYAVMSKNLLLTTILLHKKCNVNVQTTDDKWSPLHEICYKGDLEILKIFCESKQKINPNIKNNVGRTPLHYLVGVGPNKRPSLFPALHPQASHFDILTHEKNTKVRLEMFKLLAQLGVAVTTEDDNGHSPLQFAQSYDHKAFILEMGKLIKHN